MLDVRTNPLEPFVPLSAQQAIPHPRGWLALLGHIPFSFAHMAPFWLPFSFSSHSLILQPITQALSESLAFRLKFNKNIFFSENSQINFYKIKFKLWAMWNFSEDEYPGPIFFWILFN